jgi:hypothetical protein
MSGFLIILMFLRVPYHIRRQSATVFRKIWLTVSHWSQLINVYGLGERKRDTAPGNKVFGSVHN